MSREAMFGYPAFDQEGKKVITTTDGLYKDALMNLSAYRMRPGESRSFRFEAEEMAILLIEGAAEFSWEGRSESAVRGDFFDNGCWCLHVCKGVAVTITANAESEILVQTTENDKSFAAKFYRPEDCDEFVSGQGLCGDTAVRTVRTVFDYENAPYSNMVLGEVLSNQGGWSSYIPHYHPQPEVYYYRFRQPQGFGACFIGDEAFKVTDGSFCVVPSDPGQVRKYTHPQVAAPGYRMYYTWSIRHLPGDPWQKTRTDDPAHVWLLDQKF